MNKALILLQLLLTTSLTKAQTATLSGCIKNSPADTLLIEVSNAAGTEYNTTRVALDAQGCFVARFEPASINRSMQLHLANEVTSFFMEAGDSMHVTLDYALFDESVRFSGKNAVYSNYKAAFYLKFNDSDNPALNAQSFSQIAIQRLDPLPYLAAMDSFEAAQLRYLESWEADLPAKYYRYERDGLMFTTAHEKAMYPGLRQFFAQELPHLTVSELPAGFFDFFQKLRWDKEWLVGHLGYETAAISYAYQLFADQAHEAKPPAEQILIQIKIIDSISSGASRGHLMAEFLESFYNRNEGDLVGLAYDYFMASEANDALKQRILKAKAHADLLKVGVVAPPFKLINLQGKQVQLSDFEGKWVFIDFWASWCVPCISEFKHLPALKAALKSQEIVFLYVSLDDEAQVWRKSATKYLPKEVNLWAEGAFTGEVAKQYQITAIPRYVVVDRSGRIHDLSPPRPSSGEQLIQYLQQLVKP